MTNALLCEIAFVAGIRRTDWTVIPGIEMKLEIEPNDCSFFLISHSTIVSLALPIFIMHSN